MSHLFKLGLENFRLFKKMQEFDFAPITIFTGINNSGKSSVIKSLLLLRESYRKSTNLTNLLFTESKHNLGSFSKCINNKNKNQLLKFKFQLPSEYLEDCYIELEYRPNSKFPENGILHAFRVLHMDLELIYFESNNDMSDIEKQRIVDFKFLNYSTKLKLNIENIEKSFKTQYIDFSSKNQSDGKSPYSKDQQKPDVSFMTRPKIVGFTKEQMENSTGEYPKKMEKLLRENNSSFNSFFITSDKIDFEKLTTNDFNEHWFALSNNQTGDEMMGEIINIELKQKLSTVYNSTGGGYMPIHDTLFDLYLDVLKRFLLRCVGNNNKYKIALSSFGEYIFSSILSQSLRTALLSVPQTLSGMNSLSSLRGNTERLYYNNSEVVDINNILLEFLEANVNKHESILSFINYALQLFKIGDQLSIERHQGVASEVFIQRGTKKCLLADLGFGYTQLLPIILKIALVAKENDLTEFASFGEIYGPSIIMLEEPESNLHPSYQSMLADLLIAAAENFNIQFIIETHSEYFIRKLQYLVAKKELKPRNISLYYFNDPENIPKGEKQVKKIEILENGSLSDDFGQGFFDEADNLATQLFVLNKNSAN